MPQQYAQAWWGTWWPWAEANQGLLSVLALVAALILALVENKRAADAEARAGRAVEQAKLQNIRDFADTVIKLIDEFRANHNVAEAEFKGGMSFQVQLPAYFIESAIETRECLIVLQKSCPRDPVLLLQLRKAIEAVTLNMDMYFPTGSAGLLAIGLIADRATVHRNLIEARADALCAGLIRLAA